MKKNKKMRTLSKWANKGYLEACYKYGLALIEGDGITKDESLGVIYLEYAADYGYDDAKNYLENIYFVEKQ